MANLSAISSGIGMGVGLGETVWGGIKSGQANKQMRELEKKAPTYTRPTEIKQYLEMAKSGMGSQMPGTTQLTQNTQQATQGMLSKLQESGGLDVGSINKLYQSEVGAYNNLATQQAQYHQGQQDRLSQALQESAKYADQEFEYNVNAPWQRKYNRAINKYEAGQGMVNQGLGGMTGSAMNYLGMNAGQKSGTSNAPNMSSQNQASTLLDLGQGNTQLDTSSLRSTPNL
jgi:hypothetical protein